jgi:hypothetical protein
MATVLKPVVKPVVAKPVTPAVVDPTKLTGSAERLYRRENPYSDYAKQVETRYISQIGNNLKSNTGVGTPQVDEYNRLAQKWNVNTNQQSAPTTAPTPAPQQPAFDQNAFLQGMNGQIGSMYDAQQQSRLAELKASQDKATGQLNQQKAELAPQYQGERNQSDVVSAQNVQRLRELMASQGLGASGENVTAQTAQNNQRQDSLNSLNLQEQQANNDINRQMNDVNDPAQAQAIMSQIAQQRSQALLDAYNRANDVGYQRSRDSVGDQRYNTETSYNHSRDSVGDTRYNNETSYSHGRDSVGDTRYNNETTYNHGQDTIHNQQAADAAAAQAKQQAADNTWRTYTYNNMSASDKAQLAQNASQYGEDKAWQMFQLKYNGELQKSTNQAQLDAYTP